MKYLAICALALMAVTGASCTSYDAKESSGYYARVLAVKAELRDNMGRPRGMAVLTQSGDGVRLRVEGIDLPPGEHGIHLHAVGICTPPDFSSAGPHWNPAGRQHGKDNPAGMHRGDLPNIVIGPNGQGKLKYFFPLARLSGGENPILDANGIAIVIHAQADDYRTDPSGNSGSRMACGVFRHKQ